MTVNEQKQCQKCKEIKPLSDFYKEGSRPDGFKSYCKSCSKDNRTKEDRQKWNDEHIEDVLVWTARLRAKKRGIKFNLKPNDITIPSKCPLLGIPLYRGRGKPVHNSPTLDRVNPENGYVKGNVWVISHRANSIKTSASYEEIIKVGNNLKKFVTGFDVPTESTDNALIEFPVEAYLLLLDVLGLPKSSSAFDILINVQNISSLLEDSSEKLEVTNNQLEEAERKTKMLEDEILRLRKIARASKIPETELAINFELSQEFKDKLDEDDFLENMSLD